jgi:formate dehydrogenase subunit gamma
MAGWPDNTPAPEDDVLRFGPGSRLLHWAHALPFLVLLLTGLILFWAPVKALHLGGVRLLPLLHVLVGIAFILSPIPLALRLRSDQAARRDITLLGRIEPADAAWLRHALGTVLGARLGAAPLAGKFNAGQKANTVFTVIVTAGLMVTGAVLAVNFFTKRVFPAYFVEGVFPLHDWLMLLALPVVVVHIYLGAVNPGTRESLRGILGGRVRHDWAASHHPLWLSDLETGEKAPSTTEPAEHPTAG